MRRLGDEPFEKRIACGVHEDFGVEGRDQLERVGFSRVVLLHELLNDGVEQVGIVGDGSIEQALAGLLQLNEHLVDDLALDVLERVLGHHVLGDFGEIEAVA